MKVLLVIQLWTLVFTIVIGGSFDCNHTDICNCYKSDELEYQCPRDTYKVIVHTVPGKYVKIDCYESIPAYNVDIFPNLDVGDLEYFSFRFCPLPNDSFNTTLEKFNITGINSMQLEEIRSTNLKTLTKELFYGLSYLKRLSFSLFRIDLEEDFLEHLPNLTALYLDNNEIHKIEANMFKYVPKLRILHLSRNSISYLPEGLFQNLSNLQQLHLWKNELTTVNRNIFTGLKQLKSLELSSNKIVSIDDDTFADLVELVNISLRSNNLQIVNSNIFQNNKALEGIRLGHNPNLTLSDYVFANLTNLANINIDNSNLETLPEHIFEGSINLVEISIKNNNITELPEIIFDNLRKLKKLNLEGNKFNSLPDNIFSSLISLEELYLQGNELVEIDDNVFRRTPKLKILNLRHNHIKTIHLHAFIELKELIELDLSQNEYDLNYGEVEGLNPFSGCVELQRLNLSQNTIDRFPENILENKLKLVALDLNYNKISYIRMASLITLSPYGVKLYINNNNVSVLDFREIKQYSLANTENYDALHNNNASTILYLFNNPLTCDCSNFDLIQYNDNKIDPVIKTIVDVRIGDLRCATPRSFTEVLIKDLKPYHINCPLEDSGCPNQCSCNYRPFDQHAVINCSYRNLTYPPAINVRGYKIEINLDGNFLEVAPYEGLGYDTVTKLHLSNNQIKNISWIPPNIEVLNLGGNLLRFMDSKVLESLSRSTTLRNLTLYRNPWSCGCSATPLQSYLLTHYTKVNSTDVICADDNKPLIHRKELCKSHGTVAMAITIPILLILFTTATVWLYAKNLCLWFVTEEELDKDKTYDVFISYSHKDEDFVLQNLLPVLEQGPNPFKVCIHIRDWIPGEFIASQVANSVLDSRRTLVVLSESFLESVWGKMEFRTAHTQAIQDGRARVIVIKYGNINEQKLDNELKSYLKTNTYVEWGDPWFWNKLKYALPHSRQNKFYNTQKHANIMLKIDDKFELVNAPPTVNKD
ncbi:hypothetical protein NQ315_010581 [Exocentrus adspersus]|uniref:TIR domain-containing protein n=1 Tax=Exocentrus adspersus TaxID=1586481 RepID=A0AAV8W5S4_9CUCU|nr:hypothetical protein NQ315_010581 [Exocentrus adspersus]